MDLPQPTHERRDCDRTPVTTNLPSRQVCACHGGWNQLRSTACPLHGRQKIFPQPRSFGKAHHSMHHRAGHHFEKRRRTCNPVGHSASDEHKTVGRNAIDRSRWNHSKTGALMGGGGPGYGGGGSGSGGGGGSVGGGNPILVPTKGPTAPITNPIHTTQIFAPGNPDQPNRGPCPQYSSAGESAEGVT